MKMMMGSFKEWMALRALRAKYEAEPVSWRRFTLLSLVAVIEQLHRKLVELRHD